ncbi:MAG: hypothetical protein INR62_10015 [Rhodospirillales bacterium]|nr:hypothetical protein [Acetobacter sp.]
MSGEVDLLFYGLLTLSAFILAVVFLPMFFFLYKYREGNRADRAPLSFQTWKVELTWSAIPLLIAIRFFAWGAALFVRLKTPPPDGDALGVNVVGKQWMWQVQHPEGRRELNGLHVPIGRTVLLKITS